MTTMTNVVDVIKDAVTMDNVLSLTLLMKNNEEKVATLYCCALIQNLQSDITVTSEKALALSMLRLRFQQLKSADNIFKETEANNVIKTYIVKFQQWQDMLQSIPDKVITNNVNPWDAIFKLTDLMENHLTSSRTSSP